jgi:hypothetical protein
LDATGDVTRTVAEKIIPILGRDDLSGQYVHSTAVEPIPRLPSTGLIEPLHQTVMSVGVRHI